MPQQHQKSLSDSTSEDRKSSSQVFRHRGIPRQVERSDTVQPAILELTSHNLAQHTVALEQREPDHHHVYNAIYSEQASRADEVAIIQHYGPRANRVANPHATLSPVLCEASMRDVEMLYRTTIPSSMNPLQRYATLSPQLDPYHPNARTDMSECGTSFASMGGALLRYQAAVSIEQTARNAAEHTIIPEASDVNKGCRVRKLPRQRKRVPLAVAANNGRV